MHLPFYDPEKGRASPSAFVGENISVSCLCYLDISEIKSIFARDLNTDTRQVTGVAKLNTGELRKLDIPDEKIIDVIYSPIIPNEHGAGNAAHSEIRGKDKKSVPIGLTRGMANKILGICQVSEYGSI